MEDLKRMDNEEKLPIGIAHDFTLYFTELGRIVTIVRSDLYKDFSNQMFSYHYFPNGIDITYYSTFDKKSHIRADTATIYQDTKIVELKSNVQLTTHDGSKLFTDQLFWDRKNNWVFTDEKFCYENTSDGTIMDGKGMDFDKDFKIVKAHKTYGVVTMREE